LGEKCLHRFDRETSNSAQEDICVNGTIILKGIFKTEYNWIHWFKIGTTGVLVRTRKCITGINEMCGNLGS
jgi:hypothetical protein